MKLLKLVAAVALPLSLVATPVVAQEDEEALDVVTDQEATPDEGTGELALPEDASEEGKENSAEGLDTANEAREKRREFGEERARDARERRGPPDSGPSGDSSTGGDPR